MIRKNTKIKVLQHMKEKYKKNQDQIEPRLKEEPIPSRSFLLPDGQRLVFDSFQLKYRNEDSIYFLSHFHADHYAGLNGNWNTGKIFMSEITWKLVKLQWPNLDEKFIVIIKPNETIEYSSDFSITAFDANHIAGSLMFYIKSLIGRFLYTGDFRFNEETFENFPWATDIIYDTTNKDLDFPSKNNIYTIISNYISQEQLDNQNQVAFIIGLYNVGKEELLQFIFKNYGGIRPIFHPEEYDEKTVNLFKERARIVGTYDIYLFDNDDCFSSKFFVCKKTVLNVHTAKRILDRYKNLKKVVLLNCSSQRISANIRHHYGEKIIEIMNIPYSDHSSKSELQRFEEVMREKAISVGVIAILTPLS